MIVALAILTFAPVKFVHPFRVRRLRAATIALLALWAILGAVALLNDLAPGPWITAGLCVIAVYFLAIGLLPERQSS